MSRERVDTMAAFLGYRHIGGMHTNRVYLADTREEILKVAVTPDPAALEYASADFRTCLALNAVYAGKRLMPEVLEVGDDFYGTGYPWLRERYVRGRNLGAEYLTDPEYWTAHAPREIVRLLQLMADAHTEEVSATWRDKLEGMTCPPGFEDICREVVRAGEYLANRYTTGHIIHGDLQFGNLIAKRQGTKARLWLIDWEMSEVMPLGYELAMLYTFLLGPEAQVEGRYREEYGRIKPLRAFWAALAPLLHAELGVTADELEHSVVFRMGNGWLYQLDRAIREADAARAEELDRDLRLLVGRGYFAALPLPPPCARFERAVTTPRLLGDGLLNQSWRLDSPDGPYVLRVSRPERSREEVAYEHALVRALRGHVPAVIAPLPGPDGEAVQRWRGRILSLFPYIEGTPGTAVPPEVRSRQAAITLARIHRAGVELGSGQRPGWCSVDERPRLVWPAVRPVLERDLEGSADLAELFAILDREASALDAWLDDLHRSGRQLPRGPVHGDFNPRNLIFQRDTLAAVIDWDDCRLEPIAWEVAQVGLGEPDTNPRAFFRHYLDAGGPLWPGDFGLLGGFARIGALSEVRWATVGGLAERAHTRAVATLREVAAGLGWLRERYGDPAGP